MQTLLIFHSCRGYNEVFSCRVVQLSFVVICDASTFTSHKCEHNCVSHTHSKCFGSVIKQAALTVAEG